MSDGSAQSNEWIALWKTSCAGCVRWSVRIGVEVWVSLPMVASVVVGVGDQAHCSLSAASTPARDTLTSKRNGPNLKSPMRIVWIGASRE